MAIAALDGSSTIRLKSVRGVRAVASVLVVHRGRVLLVREGRRHKRGKWNLPGGKVGPGESPIKAAVRETFEETGLHVRATMLVGVHRYTSRKGKPTMAFHFVAEWVGGEPEFDGREILDLRWFDLGKATALREHDVCKPAVVMHALRSLRFKASAARVA